MLERIREVLPSARFLDGTWYELSDKDARKACEPHGLPRPGYCRLVEVAGFAGEIHRTMHNNEQVWAFMVTDRV